MAKTKATTTMTRQEDRNNTNDNKHRKKAKQLNREVLTFPRRLFFNSLFCHRHLLFCLFLSLLVFLCPAVLNHYHPPPPPSRPPPSSYQLPCAGKRKSERPSQQHKPRYPPPCSLGQHPDASGTKPAAGDPPPPHTQQFLKPTSWST